MNMSKGAQDLQDLEIVFKALASESRRHILIVLNARGGATTAGEIAGRFSCTWPTTSRNLRVLQDAGLVDVHKQGREWIYRQNSSRLHQVIGGWIDRFEKESEKDGKGT
jgi:DNA-binding transcriptional ArsR family regulator